MCYEEKHKERFEGRYQHHLYHMGPFSPLSAIDAIISLNVGAIAAAAVGVLTLLAGIFGLAGIKKSKCRVFGVILFVLSVAAVILALPVINWRSIVTAVLAWLFIACI